MTPCGWEGNRTSGVALAMRHRLQWFIHLRARGLRKGDEHPAYSPHRVWHTLPFYGRPYHFQQFTSSYFRQCRKVCFERIAPAFVIKILKKYYQCPLQKGELSITFTVVAIKRIGRLNWRTSERMTETEECGCCCCWWWWWWRGGVMETKASAAAPHHDARARKRLISKRPVGGRSV